MGSPPGAPNDFFCNSADAHQVFYWTFGWLTRLLAIATVAWLGRVLTWGLMAWAWRRLSWSLVPAAWYSVLSAALWVMLNDRCHMAGEWVIGGVEAKGFAYVLVLLGIESLVRGRWTAAWLLFGASSSFHVIVGGWSVVAAAIVWLVSRDRPPLASDDPALGRRPVIGTAWFGAGRGAYLRRRSGDRGRGQPHLRL